MTDASNAFKLGKQWSTNLARVVLGETSPTLAEGQVEAETCILESPISASAMTLLEQAELNVIDLAQSRIEGFMEDLVKASPLPRQWVPPLKPLLQEAPTPQEITARAQVLAQDERYIRQIGEDAKRNARQNQWLSPVVDRASGRSGSVFKGGCPVTCGQLMSVALHGWKSVGVR
jgi:hypothetical protein